MPLMIRATHVLQWRNKGKRTREGEQIPKITSQFGRKKGTKEVDLVAKLFDEIAPKYADRNGGYTRIVKIGQRKGDGALEVLLELV